MIFTKNNYSNYINKITSILIKKIIAIKIGKILSQCFDYLIILLPHPIKFMEAFFII